LPNMHQLLTISTLLSAVATAHLVHDDHHRYLDTVDPAALGFDTVPLNQSIDAEPLQMSWNTVPPSFLDGTFYRGAPGQWPDGWWLDGLITYNGFKFDGKGGLTYSMKWNQDDAYNSYVTGDPPPNPLRPGGVDAKGTLNHPVNSSWPTGVSFRKVDGALISNTGVTNSNEIDPVTLDPVSMPFVYSDDLGAPYVGPTHGQMMPDGHVLHHFVTNLESGDEGEQEYVVTSIPPGSRSRDVIARIKAPNDSSWKGKVSFNHMTLGTEDFYIMIEAPCYYPATHNPVGQVDWKNWTFNWFARTHVRLVNRTSGESTIWPLKSNLFAVHHINAYVDAAANEMVIDTIRTFPGFVPCSSAFKTMDLQDMLSGWKKDAENKATTQPLRIRVPLGRKPGFLEELSTANIGTVTGLEFPTIRYDELNGKKYTYVYAVWMQEPDTSGYYDSLVKINVDTGDYISWYVPGHYPNEPAFVPNPAGSVEDDGVVVTDVIDSDGKFSYVLVLNASTFEEIGRSSRTPHLIPHGYHGRYFR